MLHVPELALLDDAARLPIVRLSRGGVLFKVLRQGLKLCCAGARYRRKTSRMMRRNVILAIKPITCRLACDTAEMWQDALPARIFIDGPGRHQINEAVRETNARSARCGNGAA